MIKPFLSFFIVLLCQLVHGQQLTGKWKLEADIKGMGVIAVLLDFSETSDTTFYASSRPAALKEIVKGPKYALAKRNKIYKEGSIVHVYNGTIHSDSLRGIFTTPMMNLNFEAKLEQGKMKGALYGSDRTKTNFEFTATPHPAEFIDYDYTSLVAGIRSTFAENIYDPELLKTKEWVRFFTDLEEIAPRIHDDLEMYMYFSFLVNKISMSHIAILKNNPWENEELATYVPQVSHKMLNDSTAYIKFESFQLADTSLVREFFRTIVAHDIPYLVYDFRGCSGGDYSSMFLAHYLATQANEAGFFVGNRYYRNHRGLPDEATISNLENYDGESLHEFLQTLVSNGLLKGSVYPDQELRYTGKVFALIDGRSASATEPIAYFLKQHRLATLVGETTAGEMLSSTVITVKDKWSLMLPVADYYTSDRFRIEQKGVSPDIKVKSEGALDHVLKMVQ